MHICYDAAAMREASEAGHVVLVEITDVSIYQEIEKELRMLRHQLSLQKVFWRDKFYDKITHR